MNKTVGVCLGVLVLGLAGLGTPASRAATRLAAGEPGDGNETASSSTSAPASSSEDLTKRIDALKAELADLNSQLAAEKDDETAVPATPSQDQGATPPATAPAGPTPLPSPSTTAPLSNAIPHEISAGPFGKLEVTGTLSGIGLVESNQVFPGALSHWDVSNAQVFVQKTTGWFQFFLQGGAYNITALGVPFASTSLTNFVYGPLPVGYVKLVKGNFNVEVGELPTLIGAEYTFSFQNMNVERGLLWGQEPAISRGIQLNETYKKLTLAFSYNDGFFSNRYTTLSGNIAWAFNASNTLSFVASGNAGGYARLPNPATPLYQNNSQVYNLIYTYTKGNLLITPYYQYTSVAKNTSLFFPITEGAHTNGGAILANYNFKHGVSLAGRAEYIKSAGGTAADFNSINLLGYGPGSGAFSFTVTPAYVKDGFFVRGDISVVDLTSSTPGFQFGTTATKTNQVRGVIEAGVMF
ncbi:MAG TPA: outer membrane beta-barrel protein [Candidatus Acidoferrales bacterium]|jgi:hypothetical protein